MDAKNVEKLAHIASSIALIYIIIALIGGFGMVYLKETEDTLKDYVVSAHSHFLCMSILILIIGIAMSNWARDLEVGKYTLTGGQLQKCTGISCTVDIRRHLSVYLSLDGYGCYGDWIHTLLHRIPHDSHRMDYGCKAS